MSLIGCRIFTKVNRPDPKLVELFADLASADLADNMNRMASVDSGIKAFNGVKLLGTAVTVKVPEGNNLLFHEALNLAGAGDVIVVAGGGDTRRAICGENMIEIARQKGIRGFLVDGCIRDSDAARRQTDFAVFARAAQANGSYKFNAPGEVNVPVSVGGIVIYPGDIIVGDSDGVVAIRPEFAEKVAEETVALMNKQNANLELIKKGTSDRSWVRHYLEESGCRIFDKAWDE